MAEQQHRINCWEYKDCGRQPGGLMADSEGTCPVATAMYLDGLNGGIAGGRACWMVEESQSGSPLACRSNTPCHRCDFFRRVVFEEQDETRYTCPARTE